jgi:hypothetical protein
MAQNLINVGESPNDRRGDSLRAAFTKINANFTELYTALGLNSDGTLNLGAFEFTGSVMSTTDSSSITIDQATTVSSNLTVGGDLLPSVANGGDLGSAAKPWRSLYVSTNTVFLGGVPLSLEAGTNELTINNVPISQTINYANIPNAPRDLSDLTDNDGSLGGGEVDLTVTVPGNAYKGFGARYGRVYGNSNSNELTVSKIVIFKEAAEASSTIHPTSSEDDFAVTGLGDSDVVAMFVLYGDTNGEKSIDTLKSFARTAIDTVVLAGGVAGSVNTIAAMRSAFYDNIETLTAAAGGLVANFEFFPDSNNTDIWPENSISDGGRDQYDTANFINTNLANQISYNGGVIVENAASQFGSGSKYVVVYDESIFGIFATGSSATSISTSGNSGADGRSTTDTGELFATDRTYDPALTNLTLTNDPLRATPVNFVKADYATANNVDVIEDDSTLQIGITRGNNQGIYNPFTEEEWDQDVSPQGTLWSVGNTDDLSDVESRAYTNFYAAYGGQLGNRVPGSTAVMYVPSIEKYYLVEWNSWTQNNAGGGFSYTRTEIDVEQVEQGLRFSDGSVLKSAEGLGRVKSTAPGSRRIEEVVGYKEVSVTEKITNNLTAVASRSVSNEQRFWIDSAVYPEIANIVDNPSGAGITDNSTIQFSIDNVNWYSWTEGTSFSGTERGYSIFVPVSYTADDTVYFRYVSGGGSVVWWNKSELPGGSSNFRGAIIDYHAYTGESTIIGTIHIVDDDGEEHISHQEVQSGSTDGENDDLWLVTSEGQIRYRRIDGESKTLKIHWTAKVFYGSELYD